MDRITHWVDNAARPGTSGRTSPVTDPATGAVTARLDLASSAEVDAVVASAKAAAVEWSQTSIAQRTRLMFRFRELVEANRDEIARRLSAEHGKVLADAGGEVARALENIEYACGWPSCSRAGTPSRPPAGSTSYSIRQPLGVVAGITPFNFPAMVPLWMIPNAVACGNTFVLKPSEKDPSAPMLVAELFTEAGFPPGVLNVVHGDAQAVEDLLSTPTSPRSASSAPPRSPATCTRPAPGPASASRPSAGPRTTWSCCPTPTSTWPPTPR